jgi:PHP family Zn ribbon phosphoesterase
MIFGDLERFPLVASSDAHDLEDIGTSPTAFRTAGPELTELKRALKRTKGRGIVYGMMTDE